MFQLYPYKKIKQVWLDRLIPQLDYYYSLNRFFAWLGGMVDLVEKEQEGLKLTEAQIAELEKEFLATFETFTVVLSLSKK